ncbi:MAG: penicillin acylase family protein, partial [Halobacteria archaeon]|nr:penicillin acylase family protein [Halobacteria archaeon]
DPHLQLTVPPIWYEMHLVTENMNVRGVTFPGTPSVVIGQNQHVAWGFTNVGADVIDFYTYSTRDGEYYYKGEWKDFKTETKTLRISTSDGMKKEEVKVRKTVHGPVVEREGKEVSVAWTGLTATRTPLAVYRFNHADNIQEFREAQRLFDIPAQNTLVIDDEGNTMYYPAGKFPIRRIDGERVPGNIIFNGSKGEGEWKGFTPYGKSTWEGFVPFEEIPHAINPGYLGTANQRVVGNYSYYLGDSMYFADPYRGMRIYEMLEKRIESGEKIGVDYMKKMQRDTYSKRAEFFVPQILDSYDSISPESQELADKLRNWDRRMTPDSEGALIFALWIQHYMNETFKDEFYSQGLDDSYYPHFWVLQNLENDSRWFDDKNTSAKETKADIIGRALQKTAQEIDEKGYEDYGDYNQLRLTHPFDLAFLNYPKMEMNGGGYTLFNFRVGSEPFQFGSSWRMISTFNASYGVIPGGNSGNYFSEHYSDQLEMWASGEYKELSFEVEGERTITFVEEEE